jgi:general secretion pathway protein D
VPTTFTTLELDNPGEVMPVGAWQIQNMPLDAFLDVYADLVARTVIRPATLPQAQINFKMKTPLTKRELVQALEGVLMVNQITIIPSGEKFVTASPLADAAGMGSKLNEMDMKEIPESLQFMTQIVQLTNAYPSEVVASIQPFAKIPNGIVSIEESKLVVIRDYAVNVKRMIEILKRVDVVPDDDYSFKVIPIRYGTVEDLNNVVGTLIGSSSSVGSMGSSRTSQTGIGGRTGIGTSSRTGTSSRNNRTSSSSRLTGAQVNMQRLGSGMGGMGTFQSRMGNIMGRAAGTSQQVSLLMDSAQVIPDERSNSLIVYATKRDMEVITNVIAQLDFLLPMVLIESVIVDVNLGDKFDFGVSAAQVRTNGTDFSGLGGMFNGQGTYSSAVRNAGSLTNMPAGFSYFGKLNDEWEFGVVAAASKNKATVLQRPRILTMHGVSASFFNGQRIPYASSSYYGGYTSSANVSFDYLDVGIQLDVTPYITPNGLVLMDISQTIDEFSQWVEMGNDLKAPQTVNRDATAMIAVQDRESIMLGGFIRQSKSNGNSGVPYLKDIPLLGYLFRSTSTSNDRSELLVFIRPTILDDPEKIREFSESESKTLPGAYMALREYNRDTRNQMLSVLEEEKALDIKEKKELQKFQERMDQLDAKASKTEAKFEQRAERKDITVTEIPPTDDPAITEIETKSPPPVVVVPVEPAQ